MKKFLIIMLTVVMASVLAISFSACNNGIEDGVLNVATNCEFDPFEFLDDNGKPTGIDMDIAKALANELGLKLKIKDMAFESVVASVGSGSQDIAMAGLTVDAERQKTVDFSQTYFSSSQVVIAKKGDAILSLNTVEAVEEQLKGKNIGAQNGTTGYKYISGDSDDYDGIANANAIGYASGALAVQALINGTIDYVIIDAVPASKLVAANANDIAVLSDVVLTGEDYAFAVKKGDTELLEKVNNALTKLINDGTIEEIFNKYGETSGLNA